jgi:hypothetical protein
MLTKKARWLRAVLPVLLASAVANASDGAPTAPADARATDPVALGWMVGSPPPADKLIRFEDGSFYRFPQWRWSFSNWRQLRPTVAVPRGAGPVSPLPRAERTDLDSVSFVPLGGTAPITWQDSLAVNYTDGIVVLHRGRIVYERYFGALSAERPHIAFSVTKSFFGTLAGMLIAEGRLDPAAPVSRYIPELADSGFGDASVAQVLDMTTALDHDENYVEPVPSMLAYRRAVGLVPGLQGSERPRHIHEYLPTVAKRGVHGEAFTYRTPNTDVVGWLIERVTGKSPAVVLSERIWSRLGAEAEALMGIDSIGTPQVGGGLILHLRDLARFGELMRLDGRLNGQQIVPASVVAGIRRGGDREAFVPAGYKTLPGWSYRLQWWIAHDDHGVFMARGIHGQAIYVDPMAEMVIARFASHPQAGNVNLDPASLPAYRAIAEHLLRDPR